MDSMRRMQEIQPRLKELQEKYGKDREKLSQKQMELYKEAGVNPAMGCLPLLIQMPILFGFYYALISLGPLLDEPFLWIPSLAFPSYQQGLSWLTPISLEHIFSPAVLPYLVLPIIYILSQFVMQRMSQAANPTASSGPTGNIMMLMPLMFGYITLIVPSGLSLYWVTSNFLQIIQQGLTTGWTGLNPFKRAQPALATAGVSKGGGTSTPAVSESKGTSSPSSDGTGAQAGEAPAMSAGRRRKMRKKKR
jgi:YidC/Oxa1 family membrane protein insertase